MLQQRARFHPRGIAGRAYWWLLLLSHAVMWRRILDGLDRAAKEQTSGPQLPVPAGS